MIEKRTIIDQIEVARDGTVQLRFGLLLVEDGVEISSKWHRTSVSPGGDVDAAIAAVNSDIAAREELKAGPVDKERLPLVKAICKLAHTPDVIKAYKQKLMNA